MGLDIVAHSRLRFIAEELDENDERDVVFVYGTEFDRRGSLKPGVYLGRTLADLWWNAEHAGAELPDAERERIDQHVKAVLAEKHAHCPGDAAVLVEDPPISERHSFRAGSYSGYNRWRELLSRFALGVEPNDVWEDAEAFEGKPFVELINFSDSEGCIGPEAAAKLKRDFDSQAARAKTWGDSEDFFPLYEEWQLAVSLAADEGVLVFC